MGKDILVPRKLPSRGFYFRFRQWGHVPSGNGALVTPIAYSSFLQAIASWDDVSISAHTKLAVGVGNYGGTLKIVAIDSNSEYIGVRWIGLFR